MSTSTTLSILFVTPQPFYEWRGSPIRVKFDVQALSQLGYEVDLLAFPVGEAIDIDNVSILRAPNPLGIKKVPIGPSWKKIVLDFLLLYKALRLAYRKRYDIVHCVEEASLIGVILKRLRGLKLVYEKHSHISSYRKSASYTLLLKLYEKAEIFAIHRADLVLCGPGVIADIQALESQTQIQLVLNIPSSEVTSNEEKATAIRRRLNLAKDTILITYVGTFANYQGMDLLMDAIPKVLSQSERAHFLIIGGSAPEIEQSKRQLSRRVPLDRVNFLGLVDPRETPHYLFASDILMSPRSTGKTTPTKIFDYLKAGRAIVATNHVSNTKILDATVSVLTEVTAEGFSKGLMAAINDARLRSCVGAAGKKIFDEHYHHDRFKEAINTGYHRMLFREPTGENSFSQD